MGTNNLQNLDVAVDEVIRPVNFRDDFKLRLKVLSSNGTDLGWPAWDWEAVFWTTSKANRFVASSIGGVFTNCQPAPDGKGIIVVFNNHGLVPGRINVQFRAIMPDDSYPDGDRQNAITKELPVELTRDNCSYPSQLETELILPTIKGDPFTYEDFTPEQLAGLQKPANDAAKKAEEATKQAIEVTERATTNEEARVSAENTRNTAEQGRVAAEQKRAAAEGTRQSNEEVRQDKESERQDAEAARAKSEATRVGNESKRETAEDDRRSAETKRASAEETRTGNESSRIAAEQKRTTAESTRIDNESSRAAAERQRISDETARVANENTRGTAETARIAAEAQRATEFATWENEIDEKADRTELSNIVGVPTEQEIEDIEPGIITNALRKTPQILTPEEQAQVKTNLGISKMELFIDLWNTAWGQFGKYDPVNAPDMERPFYGNGIWLSYAEALEVCLDGTFDSLASAGKRFPHRTNLPIRANNSHSTIGQSFTSDDFVMNVEVANLSTLNAGFYFSAYPISIYHKPFGYAKLKKIIGTIDYFFARTQINWFVGAVNLEEVWISRLAWSINLSSCSKLSLESFQYMIKEAHTDPESNHSRVITVHAEVFTKLTDESNTEWHQVLLDAAEKSITFATI